MSEERCGRCKYFANYDLDLDDPENGGQCRRFPPVLWQPLPIAEMPDHSMVQQIAHVWRQPEVATDDWCGEFKPKS